VLFRSPERVGRADAAPPPNFRSTAMRWKLHLAPSASGIVFGEADPPKPGSATPATTNHGSLTTFNSESKAYGRGGGVGRGRGAGVDLGVALGVPVGVAVGV